jgi:hypothetical protein
MKKKPGLGLDSEQHISNPALRALLAKAEAHRQAEQRVLEALPSELADGSRFISIRNGDMVISTESSSIASQLRFRQHEIMAKLRQEPMFEFVWRMKVKVVPARYRNRFQPLKRPLSSKNARLLREEAGHTKDKHLREVLEKLASHVRD